MDLLAELEAAALAGVDDAEVFSEGTIVATPRAPTL